MVAKFHEQNILQEILDPGSSMNVANKRSLRMSKDEEKGCIMDVYNYAARFDTVPRVTNTLRSHRNRKYLKQILELPEQGICVKAEGEDPHAVEVRAAQLFKEEAEKYQKEHGSENIVINDSGILTADNVSKFMDFYRIARRNVDIAVEATTPPRKSRKNKKMHCAHLMIDGEAVGEPVEMWEKDQATEIAMLTGAMALKKREPELYHRFLRALEIGKGQILKPIAPVSMSIDQDCSLAMRDTLLGARKAGLPDVVEVGSLGDVSESRRGGYRRSLEGREAQVRDETLQRKLNEFLEDPRLSDLRDKKAGLPMNQYRAQVLDLVNGNVYSIVVGATGSGKTTQVPQILMDDAISRGKGSSCNIICTQPRRIAAISVARRVAMERGENLQDSVGYHVRHDAKLPQIGGSVTYCTTGILQQQLQHSPDEVMDNVSHLVIDEVHERDMLIDFLLILLRRNIVRRQALGKSNPQVVLMSATLDTQLFASYLQSNIPGQGTLDCPSLSVPGRTFPVKERYLDEILKDMSAANSSGNLKAMDADLNTKDYLDVEAQFRNANPTTNSLELAGEPLKEMSVIEWRRKRYSTDAEELVDPLVEKANALIPFGLIVCTIAHIAKTSQEGAILVFLPGLTEILKVEDALKNQYLGVDFKDTAKFKLCLLHSTLPAGQNTVFDPVPQGCRKIILATNIAETSITIPDVQYVVDTGKLREKQYDQSRRLSQLLCTWISKSNSKQRAGRAGRVQNGNYYALFTKERYEKLRAIGLPEILRTDLQEICLQVKSQAHETPIREFLAEAIEPPDPKAVDAAIFKLEALDALTNDGEAITPLGRLLSSFPVHPSLGKMIFLGIIFRCLDPIIVLGAASAERSLFTHPVDCREEATQVKTSFARGSGSDHIALLNAYQELRRVRSEMGDYWLKDVARRNFLHMNSFRAIEAAAQQIENILVEARLIPQIPDARGPKNQFGGPSLNENSHKLPLIKALTFAGLHPNLAINSGGAGFRTASEKNCFVHATSIHASFGAGKLKKGPLALPRNTILMYSSMGQNNEGNSIFLRDVTEATPLMATLFGGKLKQHEMHGNIIELDNWLPFYVISPDRRTTKIVIEFRKALERLLGVAFNELGDIRSAANKNFAAGNNNPGEGPQATYLADEKSRRLFAQGLVEVLEQDVRSYVVTPRDTSAEDKFRDPAARKRLLKESVDLERGGRAARGALQPPSGPRPGERTPKPQMPAFYADLMKI